MRERLELRISTNLERSKMREQIKRDTEAFLANGGQITQLKSGYAAAVTKFKDIKSEEAQRVPLLTAREIAAKCGKSHSFVYKNILPKLKVIHNKKNCFYYSKKDALAIIKKMDL